MGERARAGRGWSGAEYGAQQESQPAGLYMGPNNYYLPVFALLGLAWCSSKGLRWSSPWPALST